ncbi:MULTISPECIES: barstar family protein [Sphingobium]|uniref:barstar family protein n=1 Tax=Sphingobium TaxID=165695 RepID=UPI0015EBA9DF|nr:MULTISPECIES: barstar family protein [Sphingobium]MCW2364443.1 RNAse (barnase) inhibitor barstar [Sphingobium sp. B10D3B]MCW2402160.1 RNAse (barnase) inhibitor barstar [Sphingobium sp. B10D7B]MCW2409139.1 RNAse (barnase) inhibitor barstar [Sphingobium xanthum]
MLTIDMSALRWESAEDFSIEVLLKLGAPSWHGHSLDAINDSVFGGDINEIAPPFRIMITHIANAKPDMQAFLRKVQKVFADGRDETRRDAFIDLL